MSTYELTDEDRAAIEKAREWEKENTGDDLSDLICNESAELEDETCDDTAIWAYALGYLSGARDMRERAAKVGEAEAALAERDDAFVAATDLHHCAARIRALPLAEGGTT